jgi:hypothetical protein
VTRFLSEHYRLQLPLFATDARAYLRDTRKKKIWGRAIKHLWGEKPLQVLVLDVALSFLQQVFFAGGMIVVDRFQFCQ